MGFVGNLVLFAAAKEFCKRSRIDKVIAMVRVAPFLTHGVFASAKSYLFHRVLHI